MNARNAIIRLALVGVFASMVSGANGQCPPQPPDEVLVSQEGCTVVIHWTPVAGATAYGVYRGATWASSTWIGNSQGTEFDDMSAPGGEVTYWVVARNVFCVPGWHQSDPRSGSGVCSAPAPAPTNIQASDGTICGAVEVRWSQPFNVYAAQSVFSVYRNTVPIYATSSTIGKTFDFHYLDTSAEAGTTYYYWAYAENSCGGAGSSWDTGYRSTSGPASNNACAAATVVQAGQTYNGSTACATADGSGACGSSSRDVWYRFDATSSGVLHVDTCSTSALFNNVLSVHSGCPGNAANQLGCSHIACDGKPSLDVPVTAGQQYRIRVAGFTGADVGSFQLHVTFAGCYANCDGSTGSPQLSANDFQCFINRFQAGDPYANCDGSVRAPTLNIMDLLCFINQFAGGCQ